MTTPGSLGRYFSSVKRSIPLLAILSALALGASIVRALAQLPLLSGGGTLTVKSLVLLETGNWIGWTCWAALLTFMTGRFADRPPGSLAALGRSAALALVPLLVVPVLTSPWHWLVMDSPGLA